MCIAYQFTRWIITLGAQVRSLSERLSSDNLEQLHKEAASCEAELQSLYAYADRYQIDLIYYYQPFAEIEQYLLHIHTDLQRRQTFVGS